jgi:uncharacterized membrane protein
MGIDLAYTTVKETIKNFSFLYCKGSNIIAYSNIQCSISNNLCLVNNKDNNKYTSSHHRFVNLKTFARPIVAIVASVLLASISLVVVAFPVNTVALALNDPPQDQQQQQQKQEQPNINASSVYQTGKMVLGNDIKNLVILLPNENHEPPNYQSYQLPRDLRNINQTYVPDNVVVNPGTTIAWFSNDVGHLHKITLVDKDSNATVYDSGLFANLCYKTS